MELPQNVTSSVDDVMTSQDNVTSSSGSGASMASAVISGVRLIIGLLCVTLNTVTVVAFSRVERLRTRGNMLVVSLACTDILVGVILQFDVLHWAPGVSSVLSTSKAYCLFRIVGFYTGCVASILNIMFIALERYLYIVRPYFYERHVTPGNVASVIFLTWAGALAYSTAAIYDNRFSEVRICDNIEAFSYQFSVYAACGVLLVAFTVTGICYALVFRLAVQKLRQVVPAMPAGHTASMSVFRAQLQASKQSVAVALIFIVCWAPHFAASAWHVINPIPFRTRAYLTSLAISNSCCNFFVYVAFNPCFRSTVSQWARKCCQCFIRRNTVNPIAGSSRQTRSTESEMAARTKTERKMATSGEINRTAPVI